MSLFRSCAADEVVDSGGDVGVAGRLLVASRDTECGVSQSCGRFDERGTDGGVEGPGDVSKIVEGFLVGAYRSSTAPANACTISGVGTRVTRCASIATPSRHASFAASQSAAYSANNIVPFAMLGSAARARSVSTLASQRDASTFFANVAGPGVRCRVCGSV